MQSAKCKIKNAKFSPGFFFSGDNKVKKNHRLHEMDTEENDVGYRIAGYRFDLQLASCIFTLFLVKICVILWLKYKVENKN